jgi:hypothetical protein
VLFERAGEPVLREEHEFVPWAEYQVSEDYDTRTKPRYCQWQLLYVKDAVSLGTAEVSLDWLLDDDRRATLGEGYRSWYSKREEQRRSLHDQWRTLVLLLVRLQSRYAPLIKGTLTKSTSTLVFDPEVGDHVDPFHVCNSLREKHDAPPAAASERVMSVGLLQLRVVAGASVERAGGQHVASGRTRVGADRTAEAGAMQATLRRRVNTRLGLACVGENPGHYRGRVGPLGHYRGAFDHRPAGRVASRQAGQQGSDLVVIAHRWNLSPRASIARGGPFERNSA